MAKIRIQPTDGALELVDNLLIGLCTPLERARKKALRVLLTHYFAVRHFEGCWLWSPRDLAGYGKVVAWQGRKYFRFSAHRLSYEHFVGPLQPDVVVMHTCDVRACWNPAHLRAGTQAENMADMAGKGRGRK